MELLKCVYFCTQKSVIKAGNNEFQDINVPRIMGNEEIDNCFCLIGDILNCFYRNVY